MAESSGIFNWMLRGFKAWQETGLTVPKKVLEATEDYRVEMDLLGRFFDECCLLDPSKSCKSSDLYSSYSAWAEECGEHPLGNRVFGMRLKERGFVSKRGTGGIHHWVGIELKTQSQSLDDFLRDCCVVDASRSCREADLHAAFTHWTGRSGDAVPNQWAFGRRLGERFTSKKDASGKVVWVGVDLTDEFKTTKSAG